jgi:transcriptional pleiotropic regulator of transition state genes
LRTDATRAPDAGASRGRSRRGAGVTTGIVRHIDELGRIVIPIEIRKSFGLTEKDPLEISVRQDTIVLSRPHGMCVFCGRTTELHEHRGREVCQQCVAELAAEH